MARKPVERAVIPEQHLRPVGHVLMTEWAGTDRVQHCTPLFSVGLIVDLHGRPVPVTLDVFPSDSPSTFRFRMRARDSITDFRYCSISGLLRFGIRSPFVSKRTDRSFEKALEDLESA